MITAMMRSYFIWIILLATTYLFSGCIQDLPRDNPRDKKYDGDKNADIAITYSYISPSYGAAGSAATIYFDLENISSTRAGSFVIGFFTSTDTVFSTDDYSLGVLNYSGLEGNDYRSVDTTIALSTNLSSGDIYVLIMADANLSVEEINEQNNTAFLSYTLQDSSDPDLAISSASATPNVIVPGATINVSFDLDNLNSASSGGCYVSAYLSDVDYYTTEAEYLTYKWVSGVSGSSSYAVNMDVTMPWTISLGSKFLILAADQEGNITESDESNNMAAIELASITTSGVELYITKSDYTTNLYINDIYYYQFTQYYTLITERECGFDELYQAVFQYEDSPGTYNWRLEYTNSDFVASGQFTIYSSSCQAIDIMPGSGKKNENGENRLSKCLPMRQ